MRVMVTGAGGLLGSELMPTLKAAGHEVVGFGRELDVSDPEVASRIASGEFGKLDWLINCAAFTGVDLAESQPQQAYEVNALAPGYLGMACSMANIRLLHISTDFVFSGEASQPYREGDSTGPLGVYGRTKLQGEQALGGNHRAVVLRTSWLFGPNGKCFPKSIVGAYRAGKQLRVVSDQLGTPTYTPFLASRLVELIRLDPFPGIYHLAGAEVMSWFEFAVGVLRECCGAEGVVLPIPTDEYPTAAARPKYSALDSSTLIGLGVTPMPGFEEALREFCRGEHTPAVGNHR